MIHEVREYTAMPGRMPALVARFRDHTLPLFEKHGMECSLLGNTEFGDNSVNEILCVLTFDSVTAMNEQWDQFLSDPAWAAAKQASEATGPVVERVRRRVINDSAFTS